MKLTFVALVVAFAIYELIKWLRIDQKIGSSLSWQGIEADLMDTQVVDKPGKVSKIRQQCEYFAFATFEIEGKKYGCQRISFYPNDHIYNHDVISEFADHKKVTVWHNPERPGENVMMPPHEHFRNLLIFKTGIKILSAFIMLTLVTLI